MPQPGQNSLNNFMVSVNYHNPSLAMTMHPYAIIVAINALGPDKTEGIQAANTLREKAQNLPEIHRRVLENALTDLGY